MTYCSNYGSFYGIDFTKTAKKQLRKANRGLRRHSLTIRVLERELGTYLTAHEAAGVQYDTECQEIRYDDGIYLLLRKMQGWWYITDVIVTDAADAPDTFLPVYTVRNVLRGLFSVIKLVFTGWWPQKGKTEKKVVIV